jgi:hypothetical protein
MRPQLHSFEYEMPSDAGEPIAYTVMYEIERADRSVGIMGDQCIVLSAKDASGIDAFDAMDEYDRAEIEAAVHNDAEMEAAGYGDN